MTTEPDSAPPVVDPGDGPTGRPDPRLVAGWVVAAVLALVPVARMTGFVLDGSVLQYNDYWLMVGRFTTPGGGLDVGGLFEFQNHPVVLPQLVYWLNIHLFSGSNVSLGLMVVAVALALLAGTVVLLRRSAVHPVAQMVVVVMASCLLFSPNGAWNYLKAMSGMAWFGANLLAVLAVHLRSRDRSVAAFVVAVLAAVSYGTGLAVWPAVAVVGAVRRPVREWWRELPYVVGFVVTFVLYRRIGDHATALWPSVTEGLLATSRMLAFPLGLTDGAAEAVGMVVLLGVPALVVYLVGSSSRSATAAAWAGVATFGLVASTELAVGRWAVINMFGGQNRYTSLPALAWIGLAGLVLVALQRRPGDLRPDGGREAADADEGTPAGRPRWMAVASWVVLVPFALVAVAAATSGSAHVEEMRLTRAAQDLREVALRLDLADGTTYVIGGFADEPSTVTDRLVATGHHPFTGGWDLDCGLIDRQLDELGQPASPEPDAAVVTTGRVFLLRGAVQFRGYLPDDRPARCVVVANEDGVVVGAATLRAGDVRGAGEGTGRTGFAALARPGAAAYRVYVVFDDGTAPAPIGDEVTSDEIEAG